MNNITQEEFINKAIGGNCQIIDVRRPDEWAGGKLSKAQTINLMDENLFLSEIKKLDKHTPYLIYCRSGKRSKKACHMMDSMGFSKTYNLIGGMLDWKGKLI